MELSYLIMVAEIIRWKDLWHQPSESPAFFFNIIVSFWAQLFKEFSNWIQLHPPPLHIGG